MNKCNFRPCVVGRRKEEFKASSHFPLIRFTSWDKRSTLLNCTSVALSRYQHLSCFSSNENRMPRAGGKNARCGDKRCCWVVPTGYTNLEIQEEPKQGWSYDSGEVRVSGLETQRQALLPCIESHIKIWDTLLWEQDALRRDMKPVSPLTPSRGLPASISENDLKLTGG